MPKIFIPFNYEKVEKKRRKKYINIFSSQAIKASSSNYTQCWVGASELTFSFENIMHSIYSKLQAFKRIYI